MLKRNKFLVEVLSCLALAIGTAGVAMAAPVTLIQTSENKETGTKIVATGTDSNENGFLDEEEIESINAIKTSGEVVNYSRSTPANAACPHGVWLVRRLSSGSLDGLPHFLCADQRPGNSD